ncbi:MAG: S8 family peptidase [Acidobacteriota bacterium]|nr:S8 family serine peptidase [Blastocatellia bacterium]MDW8411860.1 S8 family peptidase [Acidobacteriota bacterium]
MKSSPIVHLAFGAVVIIFAYIAGQIARQPLETTRKSSSLLEHLPIEDRGVVNHEVIIKFKTGTKAASVLQRLLPTASLAKHYEYVPQLSLVRFSSNESLEDILERYSSDPDIEYIEPNYSYYADDARIPNDPYFNRLWGLKNTGQEVNGKPGGRKGADINALAAWEISTGSEEIVVGVIDTGIDYTHPDLRENMWVNKDEIPHNGIDDDGNGVIDDIHGYNAIDDSGDPMDDNDHGTHCAGTIGAVANNHEGVVGVAWKVKLMALKFLSSDGSGKLNDAIEAIDYAIEMKERGVNVRILSNSWGGSEYSRALHDAIIEANKAGILFVAAAGNARFDTDQHPHYPSSYDAENVLSVAALNNKDELATFSNYGAKSVDVAAPGVDIYSTVSGGGYEYFSGTSMATPHVSGTAALMLARHPSVSPKEAIDRLIEASHPLAALKGKCVSGGRIDAFKALK